MTYIDNNLIENTNRGFAFAAQSEFSAQVTLTPPSSETRQNIGKPAVIANRLVIPDGPNSGHDALTIKASGSDIVAIPECHSFAYPIAKTVIKDVIDVYGWDRFTKSKIMFILQRTDVEPNQEHRKRFGHWHTHHMDDRTFDLTYQFANRMGTEFKPAGTKDEPFILSAPTYSLTRFGAETEHRSPRNNEATSLSRTWGAFLVYPNNVQSRYTAANRVLRPENIDAALELGASYTGDKHTVFKNPIPLTKAANRFIQPEMPDSLKAQFPNGLRYGFHSAVHGIYRAKIEQTTEAGLIIETHSFDGEVKRTPLPAERWPIQCKMIELGAHPIEPINA